MSAAVSYLRGSLKRCEEIVKHRDRLKELAELERITNIERQKAQDLIWTIQDERHLLEEALARLEEEEER